ncbi:MAG: recombinase family protein [Faecousia sp.]
MLIYDAIYARQSVDRMDSISIESQIEYCKYETRGGAYKVFQDKGYSGKNTDRPNFQIMLESIRRGEVKRVIVYKLDRISRSILDFATMMAEFQAKNVEFISCTEKFDTSTPMGRAMLNICIVFAQLERETIQQRVTDAYISRSRKGFYMGGRIPYGYRLETYMIDGKKTSHYVIVPEEAEVVQTIYRLYAQPQTSVGDIVHYLIDHRIPNVRGKDQAWDRARVGDMVKNPIYVKADMDIYRFFKDQGAILHNDPTLFIGTNGCYLYSEKGAQRKTLSLEGHHIVLAPHEGIIPSDLWLKTRVKCLNNKQVAKPIKAKNTWLAGKIKCAKCGYALTIRKSNTQIGRYFICSRRMQTNRCEGVGGIPATEFENFILSEMKKKLSEFESLSAPPQKRENPRLRELTAKVEQIEIEIGKLLSRVADADSILMGYINDRVKELHNQASEWKHEISELAPLDYQDRQNTNEIRDCMQHWDTLEFDDKRAVVDQLISKIRASQDTCEITWKL